MIIRRGVIEDIPWVRKQLLQFSETLGMKKNIYPGDEMTGALLANIIEKHFLLICENDEEKVGVIGGFLVPHMFNPSVKVLAEAFWWVDPEHRGGRAGYSLLKAFTEFGKENVDMVIMTTEFNSPDLEKTLYRFDYKQYERNYILEV